MSHGIRISPSSSRPTTDGLPATSSGHPTPARSKSGSAPNGGRGSPSAYGRRGGAEPYGDTYPAHLHIDLLPELQGQGWGRRLIDTLVAALRERGVTGLHLASSSDNAGAIAFYPRVGFTPLPSHEGVQAFGRHL
jgi:GNAT superfamily N-acetyltransferase